MSVFERSIMENELNQIIEGEFSYALTLKGPDGVVYNKSRNDSTKDLCGFIVYDSRREQSGSNGVIIVNEMVVTLRRSSAPLRLLSPQVGDRWEMYLPTDPIIGGDSVSYIIENSKAPEAGRTIGTIRIYPKKARQS